MRNHPWIPCPSMISSLIHQDLDLEELGGEITWVPPPVVTDNIVPWPGRNIMGAWSPVFVHECSPIIFWVVGWGWRLFLILLYLVLKWTPLKWWVLLFFQNQRNIFLLMLADRWVFGGSSPKNPRIFCPEPTIELVKSLSKPTIEDLHLAIKMNQPLEFSGG